MPGSMNPLPIADPWAHLGSGSDARSSHIAPGRGCRQCSAEIPRWTTLSCPGPGPVSFLQCTNTMPSRSLSEAAVQAGWARPLPQLSPATLSPPGTSTGPCVCMAWLPGTQPGGARAIVPSDIDEVRLLQQGSWRRLAHRTRLFTAVNIAVQHHATQALHQRFAFKPICSRSTPKVRNVDDVTGSRDRPKSNTRNHRFLTIRTRKAVPWIRFRRSVARHALSHLAARAFHQRHTRTRKLSHEGRN
eukprot:2145977-Rhodomonas_salina.1